MKKRTKNAVSCQRRYVSSGILMYRERKNLVEVPARSLVNILKVGTSESLCEFRRGKDDTVFVRIQNDNFAGNKVSKTDAAPVKRGRGRPRKVVVAPPPTETPTPVIPVVAPPPNEAPLVAPLPESMPHVADNDSVVVEVISPEAPTVPAQPAQIIDVEAVPA